MAARKARTKKKSPQTPTIALVRWRDAWGDTGWHTREQVQEFLDLSKKPVYSIGFLVEDNETEIILTESVTPDGAVGALTIIPKGMVEGVTLS